MTNSIPFDDNGGDIWPKNAENASETSVENSLHSFAFAFGKVSWLATVKEIRFDVGVKGSRSSEFF